MQRRFHIDHFVAGENAAFERFPDASFDRLDVFARNHAADDSLDELEADARLRRLDLDLGVAVLTMTAGLAHELANPLCGFGDRLAISDLRAAHIGVDAEFPLETVHNNFKMQFAHAADNRLPGL